MPDASTSTVSEAQWSIGIYAGTDPLNLFDPIGCGNPVLTAESITDVPARFVADPFMIPHEQGWLMFFEVLNKVTQRGEIGFATSSDRYHWCYQSIILRETFHLSYPRVFCDGGHWFMTPESRFAGAIRLYEATSFPHSWRYVTDLVKGDFADPTLFRRARKFWMLALRGFADLVLFHADSLTGPWQEHPQSPLLLNDQRQSRPAGCVVPVNSSILRFAQDGIPHYGACVRAFEIQELTTRTYVERELKGSPVLRPTGSGWNSKGMHHLDAHEIAEKNWIACVDGLM